MNDREIIQASGALKELKKTSLAWLYPIHYASYTIWRAETMRDTNPKRGIAMTIRTQEPASMQTTEHPHIVHVAGICGGRPTHQGQSYCRQPHRSTL
jgi:hypothetical protein